MDHFVGTREPQVEVWETTFNPELSLPEDINAWEGHPFWIDEKERCESSEWFLNLYLAPAGPPNLNPLNLKKYIAAEWSMVDRDGNPRAEDWETKVLEVVRDTHNVLSRNNQKPPTRSQWFSVDYMPLDPKRQGVRLAPRMMWELDGYWDNTSHVWTTDCRKDQILRDVHEKQRKNREDRYHDRNANWW